MTKCNKDLKDVIQKFGSQTTLHGVRGICDGSLCLVQRILWGVLLSAGLIAYAVISFMSISSYFDYESITKISTSSVNSLDFPAVTFCDQNVLPISVLETSDNSTIECISKGFLIGSLQNDTKCLKIMEQYSFYDFIFTYQQQLFKNSFVMCVFNQIILNCSDYFTPLIFETGLCFTFLSSLVKEKMGGLSQTTPGFSYGLNFLIDTQTHNYFYPSKDGVGIRVLVHDQTHYPSIDEESFALRPGVEAYVALHKSVKKALTVPYSSIPCQEPGPWNYQYEEWAEAGFSEYSYGACRFDCLFKILKDKCQCEFDLLENNGCSLLSYQQCGLPVTLDFYQNSSSTCECLQLCTQIIYDYKISTLAYPTSFTIQRQLIENRMGNSFEYMRKNMISLYVYFQSMDYRTIEQVPAKTGSEIIADIGGQLGLFVGASLITVFEILECSILILKHKCCKRKKPQDIKDSTNNNSNRY